MLDTEVMTLMITTTMIDSTATSIAARIPSFAGIRIMGGAITKLPVASRMAKDRHHINS